MTTAFKHAFTSAKADGADATLVRPSNWNAAHTLYRSMTNRSGSAVSQYDACAIGTANDDSFTKTTVVADPRPLVVVQDAAGIADATAGNVQGIETTTVNVQGNVTRNNWMRFSATAGRLEDTSVASTSPPPFGANSVALTGYAGGAAGTVTALLGITNAGAQLSIGSAERTAGDVTTTSGTLVDLTGMSVTITTGARRVLLGFQSQVMVTGGGIAANFTFTIDGTVVSGTDGWGQVDAGGSTAHLVTLAYLTDALSAGSHTFKVQWRSNGVATATVSASATAKARMWAIEQ